MDPLLDEKKMHRKQGADEQMIQLLDLINQLELSIHSFFESKVCPLDGIFLRLIHELGFRIMSNGDGWKGFDWYDNNMIYKLYQINHIFIHTSL